MTGRLKAIALALIAPLMLASCFYAPGKFDSSLTLLADRSFTFAYSGEVIAADPEALASVGAGEPADESGSTPAPDPAESARKKALKEAEYRAVAEALRKEPGFARADYVGDGVFMIDYRLSGTLSHGFVFPFNTDAKMILPFVAIELRGTDRVRVIAPGFANDDQNDGGVAGLAPAEAKPGSKLDGSFTLVTDAEIVSQNNEDGATAVAGRKTIRWKATPLTRDAPAAVLRVAPL